MRIISDYLENPEKENGNTDLRVIEIYDPDHLGLGLMPIPSEEPDLLNTPSEPKACIMYNYFDYCDEPDRLYRLYWQIFDYALSLNHEKIDLPVFGSGGPGIPKYLPMAKAIRSYKYRDRLQIRFLSSEGSKKPDYTDLLRSGHTPDEIEETMRNWERQMYEKYPGVEISTGKDFAENLKKEAAELSRLYEMQFNDCLLYYIDRKIEEDRYSRKAERIRKESDVYKNAGVTKSVFSKIRSSGYGGKTYNPSKATVMALIVGAHLSVNEAATLMEKAGFRFIQGEKTDEVVCDFLKRRDFDMDKLNRTLISSRLKPLTGNAKQEHDERK